MAWVKWDSIEDFNTWHNAIKAELGLPKPSVDAEGNVIEDSVINTDYILPIIVSDIDIRANVSDDYAAGLVTSENPYPSSYEL